MQAVVDFILRPRMLVNGPSPSLVQPLILLLDLLLQFRSEQDVPLKFATRGRDHLLYWLRLRGQKITK